MGIRWDGAERRVSDRRRSSLRYRVGIVLEAVVILVVIWAIVVAASVVDVAGPGGVR